MAEAAEDREDVHEATLRVAQRSWDEASREHDDQRNRRDRALNQLSTTRTVSWAMATVLGGAVVLAASPLDGVLSSAGVQISLAITVAGLAAAIVVSVIADFWPPWTEPPGAGLRSRLELELGCAAALWNMAEAAASANERNAYALARLEHLVRAASLASALSALALLSASTSAALATL